MSRPTVVAQPRIEGDEIRPFRLARNADAVADWLLDRNGKQIRRLAHTYKTWIVIHRETSDPSARYSSIWLVGPRLHTAALLRMLADRFGRFDPYPLPDEAGVRDEVLRMLSNAPGKCITERDLSRSVVSLKLSLVAPHRIGATLLELLQRVCGDSSSVEVNQTTGGEWCARIREALPLKRSRESTPELLPATSACKKVRTPDGDTLSRRIAALKGRPATLAELISGSVGEELRARAQREGRTLFDLLEVDANGRLSVAAAAAPPPPPPQKRTFCIFGVEIAPQILSQ